MPEVIQRSLSKGELAPALYARADLRMYQTGARELYNMFVHPEGGASTRPGTAFVGPVKDNASSFRLIPFSFNTEQTYALVLTDSVLRVIKDGGYVTETAQNITGVTAANPPEVTVTGHGYSTGDDVYITNIGGMVELNNGFYTITVTGADTFTLDGVNASTYTAYTSGGTVAMVYEIATPYAAADLYTLKHTQSADQLTLVGAGYDPSELTRTGHAAWTLTTTDFDPEIEPPTGLSASDVGSGCGSYNKTYYYVVTAIDEEGNESVASSSVSRTRGSLSETCGVGLSWTASTGAVSYNIYKSNLGDVGVYGWIGKSTTTSFTDFNVAPDLDDSPPVERDPFSGANDKPTTVAYYQQRRIYAATVNNPQTVYTSQSGNYTSMRVSEPTRDSDAITFTIASQQVNEIRHIVPLDSLVLLTSGGAWKVTEGQDDVLTPSTVGVRQQGYRGASDVQPAFVDDTAVYIHSSGARVLSLGYVFESDAFKGQDLSIQAQHLFKGHTVVDLAYAEEPYTQLFLVRDDGKLACCTYHQEHEVLAWYLYEFPGALVKTQCVIREGNEDVLYIGVERTVDGETVRYVERLKERDWLVSKDVFAVDCGVTYSGASTSTIAGLRHLEGETLVALVDGNVVEDVVVTDGVVTLPYAGETVHLGLPYTCRLETLPIDFTTRDIVSQGKRKNVEAVILKFKDSRGGWVGKPNQDLYEIKSRSDSDDYDDIVLSSETITEFTSGGWEEDASIVFEQRAPLPVTILSIAPRLSVG